jgi:hypothetical protein
MIGVALVVIVIGTVAIALAADLATLAAWMSSRWRASR